MYQLLLIKRMIEDVLIFPFILIGRLAAMIRPLKKEYQVFFFFPFYHTGGAEKVHAQVANATGGNDCIIFFTSFSSQSLFSITSLCGEAIALTLLISGRLLKYSSLILSLTFSMIPVTRTCLSISFQKKTRHALGFSASCCALKLL